MSEHMKPCPCCAPGIDHDAHRGALIGRRNFFKMAGLSFGAAAAGLTLPGFGAQAAAKKTHLTADQALELLREGNKNSSPRAPS